MIRSLASLSACVTMAPVMLTEMTRPAMRFTIAGVKPGQVHRVTPRQVDAASLWKLSDAPGGYWLVIDESPFPHAGKSMPKEHVLTVLVQRLDGMVVVRPMTMKHYNVARSLEQDDRLQYGGDVCLLPLVDVALNTPPLPVPLVAWQGVKGAIHQNARAIELSMVGLGAHLAVRADESMGLGIPAEQFCSGGFFPIHPPAFAMDRMEMLRAGERAAKAEWRLASPAAAMPLSAQAQACGVGTRSSVAQAGLAAADGNVESAFARRSELYRPYSGAGIGLTAVTSPERAILPQDQPMGSGGGAESAGAARTAGTKATAASGAGRGSEFRSAGLGLGCGGAASGQAGGSPLRMDDLALVGEVQVGVANARLSHGSGSSAASVHSKLVRIEAERMLGLAAIGVPTGAARALAEIGVAADSIADFSWEMVATAAGFEIVPTGAPGRLLQALHVRLVKAAKPASRAASRATSRATSRAASRCGDEVPPSVATHLGVEAAVHPVTSGAGGGPGVVAAATGAAGVQESLLAQAEAWRAMVHPDGAPVGSDPMMGHIPFPGSMAFDVAVMAAANTGRDVQRPLPPPSLPPQVDAAPSPPPLAYPRCARGGCPCVAFDGLAASYCSMTCRDGVACVYPTHSAPEAVRAQQALEKGLRSPPPPLMGDTDWQCAAGCRLVRCAGCGHRVCMDCSITGCVCVLLPPLAPSDSGGVAAPGQPASQLGTAGRPVVQAVTPPQVVAEVVVAEEARLRAHLFEVSTEAHALFAIVPAGRLADVMEQAAGLLAIAWKPGPVMLPTVTLIANKLGQLMVHMGTSAAVLLMTRAAITDPESRVVV